VSGNCCRLPDAMQIKVLQSNPWPSECQYYSYARTGDLKSIEKLKAPCDVMSAAQLRETVKKRSSRSVLEIRFQCLPPKKAS